MKSQIKISEFKDRCLSILQEVARKRREYIVTKRGKPLARIVPIDAESPKGQKGLLVGTLLKGFAVTDFETGETWNADAG